MVRQVHSALEGRGQSEAVPSERGGVVGQPMGVAGLGVGLAGALSGARAAGPKKRK